MATLGPTLETPVSKTNLPGPSQIKEVTPKEQTPVKTPQAKILLDEFYSLLRGESLIGSNGLTGNAALLTTLSVISDDNDLTCPAPVASSVG